MAGNEGKKTECLWKEGGRMMRKKQTERAKHIGIEHNKETPSPFEIHDSSVERIEKWFSDEGLTIDSIRSELEKTGNRSCVIWEVSEYYRAIIADVRKQIEEEEHDRYPAEKWKQVLESIKAVVDVLGYLTLLQMDANATLVSMLEAKSNTERIILSKHVYTLIYEVQNGDFHGFVSKAIDDLPDVLLDKKSKRSIMRDFSGLVKKMFPKKDAGLIRNKADAHKDSFALQMEAYAKCDYGVSVVSLIVFDKIVHMLQKAMEIMLENVPLLYEQYRADIEERLRKIKRLLEKMREYEGKPLPDGGLTSD